MKNRLGLIVLGAWLAISASFAANSKSVYQLNPTWDAVAIGSGAAITLAAYVFEKSLITPRCPCLLTEVNSFDRGAIGNHSNFASALSDVTIGLAFGGLAVADWADVGWNPVLFEDFVVIAEVLAINSALVSMVKSAVARPLPRTYEGLENDLVTTPEGYRSFYSGHTSTVFSGLFAAAYTLNLRYKTGWWPYLIATAIGTSVAVERVLGGNHFATDVIVGALVGGSIGVLVPALHRREQSSSGGLSVTPLQGGVRLNWVYSI